MKHFKELMPMLALALLVAVSFTAPAMAQDGGRNGDRAERGDRRQRPDWENMSEEQREQMRERFAERFEQMRKEQNDRMRESLELSEEEYSAIQPMVEKVQQLSLESFAVGRGPIGRGGPGGFGGGRGGFGGFAGVGPEMSPQGQALNDASDALRETLDNDAASSDDVKQKLATLRQARVAIADALRQAREELRGFVTPKQEATLVLQGLLD
jgi:Spy/CpxP family protein refolding chaperone